MTMIATLFRFIVITSEWVHAHTVGPFVDFLDDTFLCSAEESAKLFIREFFVSATRLINGACAWLLALSDSDYKQSLRRTWQQKEAWHSWWREERQSTLNAVLAVQCPVPAPSRLRRSLDFARGSHKQQQQQQKPTGRVSWQEETETSSSSNSSSSNAPGSTSAAAAAVSPNGSFLARTLWKLQVAILGRSKANPAVQAAATGHSSNPLLQKTLSIVSLPPVPSDVSLTSCSSIEHVNRILQDGTGSSSSSSSLQQQQQAPANTIKASRSAVHQHGTAAPGVAAGYLGDQYWWQQQLSSSIPSSKPRSIVYTLLSWLLWPLWKFWQLLWTVPLLPLLPFQLSWWTFRYMAKIFAGHIFLGSSGSGSGNDQQQQQGHLQGSPFSTPPTPAAAVGAAVAAAGGKGPRGRFLTRRSIVFEQPSGSAITHERTRPRGLLEELCLGSELCVTAVFEATRWAVRLATLTWPKPHHHKQRSVAAAAARQRGRAAAGSSCSSSSSSKGRSVGWGGVSSSAATGAASLQQQQRHVGSNTCTAAGDVSDEVKALDGISSSSGGVRRLQRSKSAGSDLAVLRRGTARGSSALPRLTLRRVRSVTRWDHDGSSSSSEGISAAAAAAAGSSEWWCDGEDDELSPAAQQILKAGYPLELHSVTTADGYILRMERIPRIGCERVAFFQHGIMDTSLTWVSSGVTGSQAFAAWDQGFDVWLGSSRSNPPRAARDPAKQGLCYFDFSLNELGIYDMPAQLDHLHTVKMRELASSSSSGGGAFLPTPTPLAATVAAGGGGWCPTSGNTAVPEWNAQQQQQQQQQQVQALGAAAEQQQRHSAAAAAAPDGEAVWAAADAPKDASAAARSAAAPTAAAAVSHSDRRRSLRRTVSDCTLDKLASQIAGDKAAAAAAGDQVSASSAAGAGGRNCTGMFHRLLKCSFRQQQQQQQQQQQPTHCSKAAFRSPWSEDTAGDSTIQQIATAAAAAAAVHSANFPPAAVAIYAQAGSGDLNQLPAAAAAAAAAEEVNFHHRPADLSQTASDTSSDVDLGELAGGPEAADGLRLLIPEVKEPPTPDQAESPVRNDYPCSPTAADAALAALQTAAAAAAAVDAYGDVSSSSSSRVSPFVAVQQAVVDELLMNAFDRSNSSGSSSMAPASVQLAAMPSSSSSRSRSSSLRRSQSSAELTSFDRVAPGFNLQGSRQTKHDHAAADHAGSQQSLQPHHQGSSSQGLVSQPLLDSFLSSSSSSSSNGDTEPSADQRRHNAAGSSSSNSRLPAAAGGQEPYDLRVVAHSLGGMSVLIYCVMRSAAAQAHHIKRLILMSPAGFHNRIPAPWWPIIRVLPYWHRFLEWCLGPQRACHPAVIPTYIGRAFAFSYFLEIARLPALADFSRACMKSFFGGDASEWERALLMPHYCAAGMPACSLHQALHFIQIIYSGKFRLFDYGTAAKNVAHYGTPTPPDIGAQYWRLGNLPIDLMAGSHDGIIPPSNVRCHLNKMQEQGLQVTYREFAYGHMDFTFSVKEELRYYVMKCLNRKS